MSQPRSSQALSALERSNNVPKVGMPPSRREVLPPASVTTRRVVGYMLEDPVNSPLLAAHKH
jgi:hypothetical protein